MDKLKKFLGLEPFDNIVTRLLAALCLGALVLDMMTPGKFTDLSGYGSVGLVTVVSIFIIVFVFLTFFAAFMRKNMENIDKLLLIIFFAIYALITSFIVLDTWYSLCMAALGAVIIFYYSKKGYFRKEDYTKKRMIVTVCAVAGVFMLSLTLYSVLRYTAYKTPNYDFGIFCQMFENMRHHFKPVTTVERNGLLSHFSVHMSLIYYVLLPFYMIAPSPVTIQLLQVFALTSAAVPVFLLCRNAKLSNRATALFTVAVMLHPALFGGATYDFHENCLLVPLLLWMFYFFEKEKYIPMAVMAALVCMVKEDAPVYIVFFAIWIFIARNKKKPAILFGAGALIYFIAVLTYISKYGDGIMSGRYGNFLSSADDSLFTAIKNVLADPAYVFTQLFVSKEGTYIEKLTFIMQMLAPLAFLPFCVKKVSNLILVLPMILINLMSLYVYQYDIGFQYVYGPLPFLIYLAILNAQETEDEKLSVFTRIAATTAIFMFFALSLPAPLDAVTYAIDNREQTALITECLDTIPEDSVVVSSTYFIPALSKIETLYEDYYHSPDEGERADIYVVDGRFIGNKLGFVEKYLEADYIVGRIVLKDGTVLEGKTVKDYTIDDITADSGDILIMILTDSTR